MKQLLFLLAILISSPSFGQYPIDFSADQAEIKFGNHQGLVMHGEDLYKENWSDLPQALFWKKIMELSPDSLILNVARTRQILKKVSITDWGKYSEEQKSNLRVELRATYLLNADETIYATTGKNDFYRFEDVIPTISRGIEIFEENGVDPWYAQAILLIESPGQLKKSKTGAYGPFQLMPGVARAQGLTVNSYNDERENFDRSAFGASRLMRRVCIPEAKRILDEKGLTYDESEMWFRLFVMHVYHAGAGNVRAVVNKIDPTNGGQELIKSMWLNKAAGFGNNSQNYTQLALAAQIKMYEIVKEESFMLYFCKYP
ncbi:MAG: hypothetical protein KJ941_06530 [Bacteroidetes bacterium]|nr:hypothetical protein [Bacteroidota bacterium]